jgi:hypothetical protein
MQPACNNKLCFIEISSGNTHATRRRSSRSPGQIAVAYDRTLKASELRAMTRELGAFYARLRTDIAIRKGEELNQLLTFLIGILLKKLDSSS